MMILSMDLGKFNTVCCLYDTKTRQARFETIATKRNHINSLLGDPLGPFGDIAPDLVVMEACGPSGWINHVCRSRGLETIVCSTNDEAWSWKNTKPKTDRDDALKLAKMASMHMLTPVHMPSPRGQQKRAIIKYRKMIDSRITQVKNSIRSIFVGVGIDIDTGKKAWCSGRAHIDSFRMPLEKCKPEELWKGQLDMELTHLDHLAKQMTQMEKRLDDDAKNDKFIQLLITIPGVGRKTAEALVATIDDPHRFKNARQLSSYLGLTPKLYQSGETERVGRISKRGPRMLRGMLMECAWASLRYNAWAKATYERIHGGSKTRRKKAGVALARKLAAIAWAMMRDEKPWDTKRLTRTDRGCRTEAAAA
jgi:transposase